MTIRVADTIFLDTNILLTATDRGRTAHIEAREIIAEANYRGLHLAVSGQIIREYLVVATRPTDANGLGLSIHDALSNVRQFTIRMSVCGETEETSKRLRSLVTRHQLSGKRIHDANIVATMQSSGLNKLLTLNAGDFAGFQDVEILDIASVCRWMREHA